MTTLKNPTQPTNSTYESTVYGPVTSWRVGQSLGVDLLFQTSICSFNCIYCQLGDIQQKTIERKIYVTTEQVERDFKESAWESADIVTFSGSGEPTLATNLGEVIHFIKEYSHKPVMVLTNGTTLMDPAVRRDLHQADVVAIKLDAADDTILQRMNRPVAEVSLDNIIAGAKTFKGENFPGKLALQCMVMPSNLAAVDAMAQLAASIGPDEIQLNTPKRPYPLEWHRHSRGNHGEVAYPSRQLRVITEDEAKTIKAIFQQHNPTSHVLSVYREG